MFAENSESFSNCTAILQKELVPTMSCAEPIAVAYTTAKARELLGEESLRIMVDCSDNIVENVKGVTTPNSGEQKGTKVATTLGIIGGRVGKKLEVISAADNNAHACYQGLVSTSFCGVNFAEDVPNLYITIKVHDSAHTAEVMIAEHHTGIIRMARDGVTVFRQANVTVYPENAALSGTNRSKMTLWGLSGYAARVDPSKVNELLER